MRIEGWEKLLYDHIHTATNSEFAWGSNDCALWCADWVLKATGVDFTEDWRGQYSSEESLRSLLLRLGFRSPTDIADDYAPRMHPAFAQRGDIVRHPIIDCLGICDGVLSYFLMKEGITRVHTKLCTAAWKVD